MYESMTDTEVLSHSLQVSYWRNKVKFKHKL